MHPLLFKLAGKSLFGVPLQQVFRLEELQESSIQRSGASRVVIYRDAVMTLLDLDCTLNITERNEKFLPNKRSKFPTIVTKNEGKYFGLEVREIVDIASAVEEVSPAIRDRPFFIGNTFVSDENVTVIDLNKILPGSLNS